MTNILTVLPDFDIQPFAHLLPSLERAGISTADLLTLDALTVAKRAHVPPTETEKLTIALLNGLRDDVGAGKTFVAEARQAAPISTLDTALDDAFGGGIFPGYLTEIVGESAVGKTQWLLTLLLSVQLHAKSAIYISTEAPLSTTRLTQILEHHPTLAAYEDEGKPSLSHIQSTHVHSVEAQDHILWFQLPATIEQTASSSRPAGLVVIDSIAANFRAEHDRGGPAKKTGETTAQRNAHLARLGQHLRQMARKYSIAIVVANQVGDRFERIEPQNLNHSSQARTASQHNSQSGVRTTLHTPIPWSTPDPLSLDHQQIFFTGWGADTNEQEYEQENQTATTTPSNNLKTPSLGLAWTNQLATRIVLTMSAIYDDTGPYEAGEERRLIGWKRLVKPVFCAWAAVGRNRKQTEEYEIWQGGIRGKRESEGMNKQ